MQHRKWKIQIVPWSGRQQLLDQLGNEAPTHPVRQQLQAGSDQGAIWTATRDQRLEAIAIVDWQSGNIAALAEPWATSSEPEQALIQAVLQQARRGHISLVQSLTRLDTGQTADALRNNGFQHIADLVYLVSLEGTFPDGLGPTPLSFERYDESQHLRMLEIVERTYRGTLDCPSLNDVRTVNDVLAGYRSTGIFLPELWSLATHNGQDVGCLLLTEHREQGNLELVYLGVLPESRGRRFGLEMVRYAQWTARLRGLQRVVLAVDATNHPALAMYAAAGFTGWDRRSVWVHLLDDPT